MEHQTSIPEVGHVSRAHNGITTNNAQAVSSISYAVSLFQTHTHTHTHIQQHTLIARNPNRISPPVKSCCSVGGSKAADSGSPERAQ